MKTVKLDAKTKLIYQLIKWSGVGVAIAIDIALIVIEFVKEKDIGIGHKLGFSGLLVLFFVFIILSQFIRDKIKMRLQSIDTVRELGAVGQTNALTIEILNYLMIVVPIALMGGLFYYTGRIFTDMGLLMLKIAASLIIPIATGTVANTYKNSHINMILMEEKEEDSRRIAKYVAEEQARKKVGYK